jgi:PAS domain S-box-containing protein
LANFSNEPIFLTAITTMSNRALKITVGFVIACLVCTALIIFAQRSAVNSYDDALPYVRLSHQLKSHITQSNSWVDRVKAGDVQLNFDRDVREPLIHVKTLIEALAEGKETDYGIFEKIDDEEGKAIVKETSYNIQNLLDAAQARWQSKPVVITPATDSTEAVIDNQSADVLNLAMEASLREFQRITQQLVDYLDERVEADGGVVDLLSWLSILVLVATLGALVFFINKIFSKADLLEKEKAENIGRQETATYSLSNFMQAISSGNYAAELDDVVNHGTMGNTLVTMRDKLRANAEEDRKRNWTTSGLAQIGELLRTNFTSTQDLFDHIIKFVVKYTNSSQGGLFLLNEESETNKHLELVACYAYERKKYLTKIIEVGEGLVGQCFLEAQAVHLVEIPEDYISITSSLGSARPNALLLVPLKVNGTVFGVLELATFGKYEQHEIELVEKLAESIASTISTVRINESTRILLEKTQQQTEEMRAQEEEMRQNMEELEATQEEMRRKEKHIQNMLDSEKERNEISNKNRQAVMELSKKTDIKEGNWNGALEKMTMAIARQLTIARASVWTLNTGEKKLVCEKLFENALKRFDAEADRFGKDYPGYFEAVTSEEIIVANEAHTHTATRELSTDYLTPRGVQSVLMVPYFNEGKINGIICCESTDQKEWTDEDVDFLKSCADLVTLTYSNRRINITLDKLADDQETMQTIIDNIPRAVFWKGKDLKFQGCNKIFAQGAGLKSYHDLIGLSDYEMPWKEHGDAYRADDLAVMNSRKARLDLEEKNVNNEGKVSWVLTSKVPVMNKHGEIVAVLGMFEDITERKEREADIASKLQELETLKKMLEKRNN